MAYIPFYKKMPTARDELYQQGSNFLAKAKYLEARDCFEAILTYNPNDIATVNGMGNAYYKQAETENINDKKTEYYGEALYFFERVVATTIDKKLDLIWKILGLYNKAITLIDLRKVEDAINCYKEALEIAPQAAKVWSGLANAYYERRDFALAIEAYTEALQINPNDPNIWLFMAYSHYELNQFKAALTCVEKTLILNSADIDAIKLKAELTNRRYQLFAHSNKKSAVPTLAEKPDTGIDHSLEPS